MTNGLSINNSFYTYDGVSTHAQWQVDGQDINFTQRTSSPSMTFGFTESHENMYCLLTHDKFPGLTITAGPTSTGIERMVIAQIIAGFQGGSSGNFTFKVKTDGTDNKVFLFDTMTGQDLCGGDCSNETSEFTVDVTTASYTLLVLSTNPSGIVSLDLSRPESAGSTATAFFSPNVIQFSNYLPKFEELICDGQSDLAQMQLGYTDAFCTPAIKRISANNTAIVNTNNIDFGSYDATSLESLSLSGNGINSETALNFSKFPNLKELNLSDNALPGFDASAIETLSLLNCANNRIASLKLPIGDGRPFALDCSGNKLHFLTLPAPASVPGTYAYDPQDNVDLIFSDGCIDVSGVTDDAEHIAVFEGSTGDTQLRPGADYMVTRQGSAIQIRFVHDHESVRVRFGHSGFAPDFYIWSNPVTGIVGLPDSCAAVIFATRQDSHLPLEVGASVSGTPEFYSFQVDWGDGEIAIPMPHRANNGVKNESPNFYGIPSGDVKIYDPETQLSAIDISGRKINKLTVTGASKISSVNASDNVLLSANLAQSVASTINLSHNSLEAVAINPEAEISDLDISYNRLHFGTLPLPSDKIRKYNYTNQAKVPLQSSGYTVTATEYMPTLNGTVTTAKWFEADGTEIPATEYELSADGVFTFKSVHTDMYCEMYNDIFPGLTITSLPVSLFDTSLDGYQLAFTMTFPPSEIGKEFQLSVYFDGEAVIDRGDGVMSSMVKSNYQSVEYGDNSIIISGENDTDPVVVKVYATEPDKVKIIYAGAFNGRAQMNDIDISRIPYLDNLSLQNQNFNKTLDFTKHRSLTWLQLANSNITGVTLGEHTMLSRIDITNNRNITGIDVSRCPALKVLNCGGNAIGSLDLSKNSNLKELHCGSNQLTVLDLSHNPLLEYVKCYRNKLTTLDLSHNTELTLLGCDYNRLTKLDLTANTKLSTLLCHVNQLTSLKINDGQEFEQVVCHGNQLFFDTMLHPSQVTSDKLTNYEWFAQQAVPLSASGNMIPVQRYLPVLSIGSRQSNTTFELFYLNNGAEALMTEGIDYTFDPEQGIITMLKIYVDENGVSKPVKARFRNALFGSMWTASYDSSCDYIDSEWVTYTTESIKDLLKPLVRFTVVPGPMADVAIRLGTYANSTLVRIDFGGIGGWEAATDEHDQEFLATDPKWIPMYNNEDLIISIPASADDRTETTVTIWGDEREVSGFQMDDMILNRNRQLVGVTTEQSLISCVRVGHNAITDLRRVKANPETLTWLDLDWNKFTKAFSDNITGVYPGHKYFNEYTKLEILEVQDCGLTDMDLTPQQATLTDLSAGYNDWRNRTVGKGGGLDLSDFNALVNLEIISCDLIKLDVTTNPALEALDAQSNYDLSELDLSRNPQLHWLWINNCNFAEIDLTYNPLLRQYGCRNNRFRFDTLLHPDHLSTSTALSPTGRHYSCGYDYSDQADLWIDATAGDTGILNAVDVTKYMPTVTGNETAVKWFGNCESTDHAVRDGWQWTNRRIHMVDSVPGDAYAAAFAAYSDLPAKEDSRKTYGPEACWDTPSKAAGYAADDDTYDYGYAANGKYQFAYKTPALRAEFTNPMFPGLTLYTNKVDIAGKTIITGVEDVTVDEAEAEYYTIQGIRMPAHSRDELRPGIYIERRGRMVTKILIK